MKFRGVVLLCLSLASIYVFASSRTGPSIEVHLDGHDSGGANWIPLEKGYSSDTGGWSHTEDGSRVSHGKITYKARWTATKGCLVLARYKIYWGDAKIPVIVDRTIPVAEEEKSAQKVPVDRDLVASAWKSKTIVPFQ